MHPSKYIYAALLSFAALGGASVAVAEKTSHYTASTAVNPGAPVHASHSIRIYAPPERVWQIMTDIDRWPAWQPEIPSAHMNGQLGVNTTFDWKTGGLNIHSTLRTVEPRVAMGWSGAAFGSFAVHTWRLTPGDGYTDVHVDESMEGWLIKLAPATIQAKLDTATQTWLAALKRAAQAT